MLISFFCRHKHSMVVIMDWLTVTNYPFLKWQYIFHPQIFSDSPPGFQWFTPRFSVIHTQVFSDSPPGFQWFTPRFSVIHPQVCSDSPPGFQWFTPDFSDSPPDFSDSPPGFQWCSFCSSFYFSALFFVVVVVVCLGTNVVCVSGLSILNFPFSCLWLLFKTCHLNSFEGLIIWIISELIFVNVEMMIEMFQVMFIYWSM